MSVCRPLTSEEILTVSPSFSTPRDRALFWLGLATGLRVSELTALSVTAVCSSEHQIRTHLELPSAATKGTNRARSIPIAPPLIPVLNDLLLTLPNLNPYTYIFLSRKGQNQPITPRHARRILTSAFRAANLNGKVSSHSLRKTFADRVHQLLGGDIFLTQKALGHLSPSSTVYYLSVDQPRIDQAIREVITFPHHATDLPSVASYTTPPPQLTIPNNGSTNPK